MTAARPIARDVDGLYKAAMWTFIGSLLLFPLAFVSLVQGGMLVSRGDTPRGLLIAALSVVVLVFGLTVVIGAL